MTGIDVGTFGAHTMTDIRIGGANPGEANVIAGQRFNGITLGRDVARTRISGKSLCGNGALGVDHVPSGCTYGVTPNDPLDEPSGATSEFSACVDVAGNPADVVDHPSTAHWGVEAAILANPLNPFRELTSIRYSIAHGAPANLSVHDVSGRPIRHLVAGATTGISTIEWAGGDDSGWRGVPGVHLLRMDALGVRQSRRLIVVW